MYGKQEFDRLKLMRVVARVKRLHTLPPVHQQTVGEHTFGILALIDIVLPTASKALWRAALYHDAPEGITGDVPSPVKWRHPELESALRVVEERIKNEFSMHTELSGIEKRVLKFCDIMELVIFSMEEVDSGNRIMATVAMNGLTAIRERGLMDINEQTKWLYEVFSMAFEARYSLALVQETYHGWPVYK